MAFIPIEQLASKVGDDLDQFSRAFTISLFNGVVRDTRVDTGRMRGSWMCTVGSPASGTPDRIDPTGSLVFDEIVGTVRAESVNWLTSNLPYTQVWEERDGMVARNVARLERITKEAAR